MKSHITRDDVFSEMILLRAVDQRAILLVEGSTDIRALDPHIDHGSANCIQGYGKENCLGAMELVDDQGLSGVVALLDRDWEDVASDLPVIKNIVFTDDYDLDATIAFTNDCMQRVVSNFCDPQQVRVHLDERGHQLADVVEGICGPIGVLRYASTMNRWELKMSEFPVHEVATTEPPTVAIEKLIIVAMRRSRSSTCSNGDAKGAIDHILRSGNSLRYYCCGHDMHRALAYLARSSWGAKSGTKDSVARALRAAFSANDLRSTRFYERVSQWASVNNRRIWL